MSMHMLGPAYTTTSTRKRTKKVTASSAAKMHADWVEHNRQMKRLGCKTMTYEVYVEYRAGKYNPQLKGTPMPESKVDHSHQVKYPSGDGVGTAFARTENVYSGTRKLLGVAVMHKSNLVPVWSQEDATEIARMRR